VQLRFETGLTGEEYVRREAWRDASLEACPVHGHLRCGIRRHGTYRRVRPAGARVPRWYCRKAHQSFSKLAECFAAHLSGTLVEVEEAVLAVEHASSQEAALEQLRTEIGLPGALRWIRRRLHAVHTALAIVISAQPESFAEWLPTVSSFRHELEREPVLPFLRNTVKPLAQLPAPLGFRRRWTRVAPRRAGGQQPTGTEPPPASR
jgi:hypothetical protein